jgi:hypothetical protein
MRSAVASDYEVLELLHELLLNDPTPLSAPLRAALLHELDRFGGPTAADPTDVELLAAMMDALRRTGLSLSPPLSTALQDEVCISCPHPPPLFF